MKELNVSRRIFPGFSFDFLLFRKGSFDFHLHFLHMDKKMLNEVKQGGSI